MDAVITCALCNSLGSNDGNFTPNSDESKMIHARIHFTQSKILDDETITEDEILQRCFAARPTLSRIECKRSLVLLCKSLLHHQPKSATIVCNMCGTGITTKTKRCMVEHACAHLEVKIFHCRHCTCSSSSRSAIRHHIRQEHDIQPTDEDLEDKTVGYFDEIASWIKRCFSTRYPRATGIQRQFVISANDRNRNQRSIVHLCRSIYIQRTTPANIDCNLCGSRVLVRKRIRAQYRGLNASAMFRHAAAHMDIKLFSCLHCEKSVSTKQAMRQHLKNSHQVVDSNSDDFEDRSAMFHSEYLIMIERCFSGDQVKLEPTTKDKTTIRAEASVRCHTTGSKLAVERRLFYHRVVRKAVDADGKIKCSLCSKRIAIKFSSRTPSNNPMCHAEKHLQKPLYRCKVCTIPFSTRPIITEHLKRKHALGREKNYQCVADEFHKDIMAMLGKCYGTEGF